MTTRYPLQLREGLKYLGISAFIGALIIASVLIFSTLSELAYGAGLWPIGAFLAIKVWGAVVGGGMMVILGVLRGLGLMAGIVREDD